MAETSKFHMLCVDLATHGHIRGYIYHSCMLDLPNNLIFFHHRHNVRTINSVYKVSFKAQIMDN